MAKLSCGARLRPVQLPPPEKPAGTPSLREEMQSGDPESHIEVFARRKRTSLAFVETREHGGGEWSSRDAFNLA